MASVNATRGGISARVTEATESAKLIGFNSQGEACVWSGGYTFNVYDVTSDWTESRAFTSGQMVDYQDKELAKERMEMAGFEIVE